MAHLKSDLINGAYSQLRISGLTVNPSGEDLEVAIRRLENMVAEFDVRINYNFEDTPDANSLTNVDRQYWHALETNLAVRLVPDFNKQIPQILIGQATQSLSRMLGAAATPRQTEYPDRMARGSGNTQRFNRWNRFYRPVAESPNEPATNRMIIGDIQDFTEHFDSYLGDAETISSFTINASDGLTIQSSSLTSPDVDYRIRADGVASGSDKLLNVIIVATTSLGRKETRVINFELSEAPEII